METKLAELEFLPYLNSQGLISEDFKGKIGIYAIFNQEKELKFVGYSRDIYLSLKQHLVRQLDSCYWIKVQFITKPSRTILEEISQAWLAENKLNNIDNAAWTDPIDTKKNMSEAEKEQYQKLGELEQIEFLRNLARKKEASILAQLKTRGVQMEWRFNPKLKEQGLLDLK